MRDDHLFRILGAAAILGGGLRMGSSFIPWDGSAAIEALAFAIDVSLLFGLMGVYLADRARLGAAGFMSFAVSEAGIASIVGPDGMVLGLDTYQLGVLVIAFGLFAFGVVMLVRRAGSALAALLWIGAPGASVAGTLINQPEAGFATGGVLFGAGFVAAGVRLVSPGDRVEQSA